MSAQGYFLLQDSSGWQIAAVGTDDETLHKLQCDCDGPPNVLAEAVEEFIQERGLSNVNIVIGVSSTSALAGSFEVRPEDQRTRRTLEYELESVLPYAAEEVVADFICSGNDVLGVAVRVETWLPIVIELEVRGLRVQSISPVALLALQSYLDQVEPNLPDLILWHDDSTLEMFRCRDGAVTKWCRWYADIQAATRQLAIESLNQIGGARCELINASNELFELDFDIEFSNTETASLAERALQTCAAILDGNRSPLVELRREELAAGDPNRAVRGSLQLLFAAAAIFLIALTSVFWIKSAQYQRRTHELQQQQVAEFRDAFPESRVPAAVLSRLRSEHAKLAGARSGKGVVEFPVSALHVLFEFLSALPENQRYRFRECRIEDGKIDLDVELRSHNEANVLVGSFENRGFSVTAPTTVQQSEKTVTSRIFANIRAADPREEGL